MRVVDRLEVVQVEIKQGQSLAVTARARQPLIESADKPGPIGEPGEFVMPGATVVLALGAHGRDQHSA